jgi:phosphorylcholine metabolism protein LicD
MAGDLTLEGKRGEKAVVMLKKVTRLLEKIKIPYILEAGTLLGVIRENRLLPWDNDLDITITRQFEKQLLKNIWKLRLYGYQVRVKYYKEDLKYFKRKELRIIKIRHLNILKFLKKDVVLDIFVKRKIGNEYYWTVGVKNPVLKAVPETFYDNLTQIKFSGKLFSVPEDSEGYLENHYGKDWRIPVKEWNFRTSDCSIKEFL